MIGQPIPKRNWLDIDEAVEVGIREIIASLLSSNEFLNAGYFGKVLIIVCMFKMGVEISGPNDIG
jgi:hypothetical protein